MKWKDIQLRFVSLNSRTWSPRFRKINREKLYRRSFTCNSIAAAACGYFAADLLVASLCPQFPAPEPPRARSLPSERRFFPAYAAVILPSRRPNLFSEKGAVPDNDEGGRGDINGPPVKTSLPLNLLGVIVVDDPKKSVASVEDKASNQVTAVRVGEPITAGTEVQVISGSRVVFLNFGTNRREFVELPEESVTVRVKGGGAGAAVAPGVTKHEDGHVVIKKEALAKALDTDFGKLITQMLCVPAQGQMGFQCKDIEKDSIFEKIGIQNGDIITAIDGEALANPAIPLGKLAEMRAGRAQHMSITYVRAGQTYTSYYDVE